MKNNLKILLMIGLCKKVIVLSMLVLSSSLIGQIDRSMPEAGPAPEIEFKEPYTTKLSNNLTLMENLWLLSTTSCQLPLQH